MQVSMRKFSRGKRGKIKQVVKHAKI